MDEYQLIFEERFVNRKLSPVLKVLHITRSITALFLIWTAWLSEVSGQSASEYQVKAVFIYNFTRFIDWPSEAFKSPDEPFIIGIIGEDPFGTYLDETVTGEKIGTHPIQIQRFADIKQVVKCHILYVSSYEPEEAEKILSAVADKSILTVSDATAFNKWGGMIRFFTENNKIRLQVNVEASKKSGLTISSKLLGVAQIY